ncbi:MAG: hypothetical protein MI861_18430, partial [Pirellulales bacterium]|nr:hypothetical protein [Pirellulales bacterium]
MTITLYSPGPFSGTASFALPEIPQTVFVKVGNPVVGTETIDGQTLLTQQHEFRVITLRSGRVLIPAFQVRFQGKPSFVDQPEPMRGTTNELEFQSRQPPGTQSPGTQPPGTQSPGTQSPAPIIAAEDLEISQRWMPESNTQVRPGDVVQRTVTRSATGTTCMLFPPVKVSGDDNLRVYHHVDKLKDSTDRGQLSAIRVETIQYQFSRAGTYTLPPIEFTWWDLKSQQLTGQQLQGRTIKVVSAMPVPTQPTPSSTTVDWPVQNTLIAASVCLILVGLFIAVRTRRSARFHPETDVSRQLIRACKSRDAAAAYTNVLAWTRIVGDGNIAL